MGDHEDALSGLLAEQPPYPLSQGAPLTHRVATFLTHENTRQVQWPANCPRRVYCHWGDNYAKWRKR